MSVVVKCADFRPEEYFRIVPVLKNRRGNPSGKTRHYLAITTAFDIETTLLEDITQTVMYIWQWQFSEDYTVIGRTWDEFLDLQERIIQCMPQDTWLVVYVHNLSYEFTFLKGIYNFAPDEVFALKPRKVLKCDMRGTFEFRCSYLHSNMSLALYTKKMNVKHQKLSGEEFDYSEKRYPWTELSERELEYCVNDVLGLVEAINTEMAFDGDNLQTIPLTSTGYVRRNAKKAMRGIHHNFVHSILPDYPIYTALAEAFRGGNTHANRYYADDIIPEVHSADRSSSYPAVMCNCEFPMTAFIKVMDKDLTKEYITNLMTRRHKAVLMRIRLQNVELRNKFWGCPYLSIDKCRNKKNVQSTNDNGRILSATDLVTTVTDIDFKIILKEYKADITILEAWYASYKKLPQPLIDEVIKYYKNKTELKGVEGQEMLYDKSKALLNSLYGMMAQSSIKHSIMFRANLAEQWDELDGKTDEELLVKYNSKAFLAYQWGVWVTAWSRWEFERGVELCHSGKNGDANFIYGDTDSCKYTGEVDWTKYNKEKVKECKESGAYATDPKGITHYMGVFESEDNECGYAYYQFKTLGAKKYAYVCRKGEEVHATIAGVNKKLGGKELTENGGLSAFREGFVFHKAGGIEAVYNDFPEIDHVIINGHYLKITSNVCLLPSEYTLGITGEYERIIKYYKNYLDNPYVI